MTDVSVTIQENSFPVLIDSESPEITITDAGTSEITIIQAQPVTVVTSDGDPQVIVNAGSSSSVSLLLSQLTGQLSLDHFNSALTSDLEKLEELWIRIGNDLLLTYPEGLAIQEAGRAYTNSSIQDVVADMEITMDGKIDIAYSSIMQTATAIDQRVTSIKGETDGRLLIAESQILQTANDITSTVSRLDTIDGPGGMVSLLQTGITQTADSITLEAIAREEVDGRVTEARSDIELLSDSLSLMVTTLDSVGDRTTTAEITLAANGIQLSAIETSVLDQAYSIGTVQTLLTNYWGVIIEEDVNGNKYSSGFGLIQHPTWLLGEEYNTGDTVFYSNAIYECLAYHIATTVNAPDGTGGGVYWNELPDGVRSEFVISADALIIRKPDNTTASFFDGDMVNSDFVDALSSSEVGALAYEDLVELAQLGTTVISGGYIKTELLDAENIVCGNIYQGTIYFARSDQSISGTSTTLALQAADKKVYLNNTGGILIDADDGSNGLQLLADTIVTSQAVAHEMNTTYLRPYTDSVTYCGTTDKAWKEVHSDVYYENGGGYLDDQDDLTVLHDMQPKRYPNNEHVLDKNGRMLLDLQSLPDHLTNRDDIRQKLKNDNGDLITDSDIDEIFQDDEDFGGYVKRNIGRFSDIGVGAIRQLDVEVSGMIEQLCDWIQTLTARVEQLESMING